MNLTSTQIKDTYGNLLTIGSAPGTPTTGTIQNGAGNDITTLTVAGTLNATTLGGTLSTAAQTNITSVGTLSALGVSGTTGLDGAVTINDSGADVDFRVEGDTEQNLLFVDASADKVGIGTNTPSGNLHISDSGDCYLVLTGNSTTYSLLADPNGLRFFTGFGGTERLRIDSSGNVLIGKTSTSASSAGAVAYAGKLDLARDTGEAITFNHTSVGSSVGSIDIATTGISIKLGGTSAANALDDYEQGTFTPAYAFSTSGSAGYVAQYGSYTKIGDLVWVQIKIATSSISSPTGNVTITGLPFTSNNDNSNQEQGLNVGVAISWNTDMPNLRCSIDNNTTIIALSKGATNASTSLVQGSDMTSGTANILVISGCYKV